jgi:Recombinase/Recombinase zinc beta ribbon domain
MSALATEERPEQKTIPTNAQMESKTIARECAASFGRTLEWYRTHFKLTTEEAIDRVHENAEEYAQQILRRPANDIDWHDIDHVDELVTSLPVGYYRADGDKIVFDPDEQVQSVVRLIFAKFEEFRSASAVLRYFVQNKITIGIREHAGPERGQLRWRRPKSGMILAILKHPIYTGAYVYGRRTTDQRRRARGVSSGSTPSPNKEDWQVFLPDKLPAYITWDQFCSNQKQLQNNRARMEAMGAAREGLPLLGGLVFCGRCGCRMTTCFKNRSLFRYVCCQRQMMYGDARCQNLAGRVVDTLITEKVLAALEPAALDLSLQAITDLNSERERLHTHWKQRLEGARYNTDRVFRQYNATEPENRLVARTLEKRWEKALHDQQQLEEEYQQFCRSQPNQLTEDDQAMIRELSSSIPALWNSTATSQVDRKKIVRHLIERIVVAVQGETEIVAVTIHWAGGFRSEHEIPPRCAAMSNSKIFND